MSHLTQYLHKSRNINESRVYRSKTTTETEGGTKRKICMQALSLLSLGISAVAITWIATVSILLFRLFQTAQIPLQTQEDCSTSALSSSAGAQAKAHHAKWAEYADDRHTHDSERRLHNRVNVDLATLESLPSSTYNVMPNTAKPKQITLRGELLSLSPIDIYRLNPNLAASHLNSIVACSPSAPYITYQFDISQLSVHEQLCGALRIINTYAALGIQIVYSEPNFK